MKLVFSLIVSSGLICSGNAQSGDGSSKAEEDVRRFLVGYVESRHMEVYDARYAVGFFDLNGDGNNEAIVYLLGRDWCGTGGCLTLVLTRSGNSYRTVGKILVTRPPIRVLGEKSHGWRTLAESEAELPFNGERYPISAAPPYAPRLRANIEGNIVIPSSAGDIRNGRTLTDAR